MWPRKAFPKFSLASIPVEGMALAFIRVHRSHVRERSCRTALVRAWRQVNWRMEQTSLTLLGGPAHWRLKKSAWSITDRVTGDPALLNSSYRPRPNRSICVYALDSYS